MIINVQLIVNCYIPLRQNEEDKDTNVILERQKDINGEILIVKNARKTETLHQLRFLTEGAVQSLVCFIFNNTYANVISVAKLASPFLPALSFSKTFYTHSLCL